MNTVNKDPAFRLEQLKKSSGYIHGLLKNGDIYNWAWERENIFRSFDLTEFWQDIQEITQQADSCRDLLLCYRRFKQRHVVRIAARELFELDSFTDTTAQLSYLAQVCLQSGMNVLKEHPSWWMDENSDHEQVLEYLSELTVLAMDRLAGYEMDYVSEVSLICLHNLGSRKELSGKKQERQEYLHLFVRYLVGMLHDFEQGERVFPVDLRLRPDDQNGESIPYVHKALNYYQIYGPPRERKYFVKSRPVAGNKRLGEYFLHELQPFVFQVFSDAQIINDIRDRRDNILRQQNYPDKSESYDVRLGKGGLDELEFMVQVFQLLYGGYYKSLQHSNTLTALDKLLEMELISFKQASDLKYAYIFLRRVEHWIQLQVNNQSGRLPESEQGLKRLAWITGFGEGYRDFGQEIKFCTSRVQEICADLLRV